MGRQHYKKTKAVTFEGRKFTVCYDSDGKPVYIKERKLKYKDTPYEGWRHVTYWHFSQRASTGPETIIGKILAEAKK